MNCDAGYDHSLHRTALDTPCACRPHLSTLPLVSMDGDCALDTLRMRSSYWSMSRFRDEIFFVYMWV